MRLIDRLRGVFFDEVYEEAVARAGVSTFIDGLRTLCAEEGPWAFVNLLEADEDATPRQIAYLLVWRQGPECSVWPDLQRFDAVDLAIDAAAEGFKAFVDKSQAAA